MLREAGAVETTHRGGTAVSRIDDCGITQLYLRAWSVGGGDIAAQVREIYANMHRLLLEHGAGKRDIVTQKAFFSNLDDQIGMRFPRNDLYTATSMSVRHALRTAGAGYFRQWRGRN